MRKFLFLTLLSCLVAFGAIAQEQIVLADYEVNSIYPERTGGWNTDNVSLGIDNPRPDDVNGSEKVASLHKTTQWSDAVTINEFNEAISLGMYPLVKVKVLSVTTVSKKIGVSVTDIYGFSQQIDVTLPDNSNIVWTDLTFDFSEIALNTPISFISSMVLFFDYGTGEDIDDYYYFDDVRFTGPKLNVDPAAQFTLFEEKFNDNPWWLPTVDGYMNVKASIGDLRTMVWGGSALTALAKHYNESDSLKIASPIWQEGCQVEFESSSVSSDFSYLNMNEIGISGYAELSFSYDLKWKTEPESFLAAPTIQYSVDGGGWNEALIASTDSLPQDINSWGIGVTYLFSEAPAGTTMRISINNNTEGTCFMDNIKLLGKAAFVSSVAIAVSDGINAIDVEDGTKQMVGTVLPAAANQNVLWSIIESDSTGRASISSDGVLTAMKNGTISVIGRSLDLWGTIADTLEFVLTNQAYTITNISITGADTISTDNGKASYLIEVTPEDADTLTYTLNVVDSSDNVSPNAFITPDGILTAVKNGYVIIKATADDYMGVIGQKTVVIENQEFIPVESIELIGSTTISINGGTLQVSATVLPVDADNRNIEWSVTNGTGSATVSADGLVQAVSNGTVTVVGSAMDGSGVSGTLEITITNQVIGIASRDIQTMNLYPNPVQQKLYIKNVENIAAMEIVNSLGTVVMTGNLLPNQPVDVQNLKSGLYIIRAISNDAVYQATFIKN